MIKYITAYLNKSKKQQKAIAENNKLSIFYQGFLLPHIVAKLLAKK